MVTNTRWCFRFWVLSFGTVKLITYIYYACLVCGTCVTHRRMTPLGGDHHTIHSPTSPLRRIRTYRGFRRACLNRHTSLWPSWVVVVRTNVSMQKVFVPFQSVWDHRGALCRRYLTKTGAYINTKLTHSFELCVVNNGFGVVTA